MKALIDTNVVLDVLLGREPFYASSLAIMRMIEEGKLTGYVSSFAITDIFYFVQKKFKETELVYNKIEKLSHVFVFAAITESTVKTALALRWKDFEDAVQYAAARELDIIDQREPVDFFWFR
jgi:predicted nucleic acid-binding protein